MSAITLSEYRTLASISAGIVDVDNTSAVPVIDYTADPLISRLASGLSRGFIYQPMDPEHTEPPIPEGYELVEFEAFETFIQESIKVLNSVNARIDYMLDEVKESVSGLADRVAAKVGDAIGNLFEGFGDFFEGINEGIGRLTDFVKNMVTGIKEGFGNIVSSIGDAISNIGETFGNIFEVLGNTIKTWFTNLIDGIKRAADSIGRWFSDTFDRFMDFLKGMFSGLKAVFSDMGSRIAEGFKAIGTFIKSAWQGIVTGIKNAAFVVGDFIRTGIEGINTILSKAMTIIKDAWSGLMTIWQNSIDLVKEFFINLWLNIKKFFSTGEDLDFTGYTDIVAKLMTWIMSVQYDVSKKMYEGFNLAD